MHTVKHSRGAAAWLVLLAIVVIVIVAFLALLPTINKVPTQDEAVIAAWSQVTNQYKRRADLVPNLVNTVKGFAQQEKDVLTQVVEALKYRK